MSNKKSTIDRKLKYPKDKYGVNKYFPFASVGDNSKIIKPELKIIMKLLVFQSLLELKIFKNKRGLNKLNDFHRSNYWIGKFY